jgi:ABC-type multidrug transport system fused ATPase/permease subunit
MLQKEGVIVLDEPTAALDPIAEIDVYSTLIDKYKNRTIILVSHRMTATVLADLVIVMSKGEVIEQGSHSDLMKNKGKYYDMFQAQAAPYLDYYQADPGHIAPV